MQKILLRFLGSLYKNLIALPPVLLGIIVALTLQPVSAFQTPDIERIDIVTEDGAIETIRTLEVFRQKPYWESIEPSIELAINGLNTYLGENPSLTPDNFRLIILGITNEAGEIVPLVRDDITPIYISFEGTGLLFLTRGEILVSNNENLFSVAPHADYVAPYKNGLVAFTDINTDKVVQSAFGTPKDGRIEWNNFSQPEQIPDSELKESGNYTSGVRFTYDGKTWEFLTDLPYTLDAKTTNLGVFTEQIKQAVHSLNAGNYESPTYKTVQVLLYHDEHEYLIAPANDTQGTATNTTQFNDEQGLILEKIPYNTVFLNELNSFDSAGRKAIINEAYLFQLCFGRATMGRRDRSYDLFFTLMDLPKQATFDQIKDKFKGLGIK